MKIVSLSTMMCTVLVVGGCQTPLPGETVVSSDPPVFDTGILTSNETNRLGRADLAAGNYGMAERHFREAVEKDKNDAPSWIGLAAAYDNLSRFELADQAYAQAVGLLGETLEVVNNLGYSYLLRGDKRRALQHFERALRLDPTNAVVRNNIKILRAGERPNRAVPL
ncbi:tetratricopeptide repeat protein [Methylobacterium sp. J-059]|uniref:tetratricopeptide repeat protein n=1 Tax=Methylobacterium sp. J-059 TaxID=2836643 RepID=UPI001FB89261|nr:tetratricopeptide repeat protein [Methylobacterium sp. J-059]MCJ2039291.1 tetratricopeptide repeat protein [Methylobacterium sp. J-059]